MSWDRSAVPPERRCQGARPHMIFVAAADRDNATVKTEYDYRTRHCGAHDASHKNGGASVHVIRRPCWASRSRWRLKSERQQRSVEKTRSRRPLDQRHPSNLSVSANFVLAAQRRYAAQPRLREVFVNRRVACEYAASEFIRRALTLFTYPTEFAPSQSSSLSRVLPDSTAASSCRRACAPRVPPNTKLRHGLQGRTARSDPSQRRQSLPEADQ